MLNQVKGSTSIIGNIQCNRTRECGNDACFWRQRDVHHRNPFVPPILVEEYSKIHAEIDEKYGKPYFPEIYATT